MHCRVRKTIDETTKRDYGERQKWTFQIYNKMKCAINNEENGQLISKMRQCKQVKHSCSHLSLKNTKFEKIKSTTYICIVCNESFSSFDALSKHIERPIPCSKAAVSCPVCNKTFINKSRRNAHLNTHKKKIMHPCGKCGKQFTNTAALQLHLECFHTNYFDATPSGFSCKFCTEHGPSKQAILQHINKCHMHVTTLLCDKCGKSCFNESSLKSHILIHSNVKPFMCQICSKSFKLQNSLKAHILTHSEERRFICDECGKTFKKNFTLMEHKKYHAGFFPFICNICDKRFVSKSSYNGHIKNHTFKHVSG